MSENVRFWKDKLIGLSGSLIPVVICVMTAMPAQGEAPTSAARSCEYAAEPPKVFHKTITRANACPAKGSIYENAFSPWCAKSASRCVSTHT